ncbi:hypothetical protein ACP70R_034150 [Stipagrostis hirtigluma subsp. patula]
MSSLLPILLLCSSLLVATTNAGDPVVNDCPSNTNYTRGSAFQANLDALLSSLPAAAAASSGFAKNVTGAAPDQVYGLAQCRADVNASECRACLDGSARDMARMCPGQKNAMVVYDRCLLRHSSASFFGAADTSVLLYLTNATEPEDFEGAVMNFIGKAAYASPRMFAAGNFMESYSLAQCTRDLAHDECNTCLVSAVASIPKCCGGKQGGQVIYRSCSIRFEAYPFYNVQSAEAAMSPAPGPGGGPINGTDPTVPGSTGLRPAKRPLTEDHSARTPFVVSIPIAVTLLVLLLFAVCLYMRNRKRHKRVQIASAIKGHEEELRSSEFLFYDLSTLQTATDNFSAGNKLGEGGFGPVYKGTLQNGQEIAVKRLSTTSRQGQVEMKNEVVLVAELQHKNLVRLLGCCIEEHEKLLVYEFLSNNSLHKILFGSSLVQMKIYPARQQELSWRTYGYMAPEYARHSIFSVKSDIFSYGVLVLETYARGTGTYEDLLPFVWRHWSCGGLPQLLDGCWVAEGCQPQEMLRCVHVGLLCVQEDPQLRPAASDIILMLNSRSIALPTPTAPPAFADAEAARVASPEHSVNYVSISEFEPR